MSEPSNRARLRDLDDDLGAAFRSADRDAPRPHAKAALLAALGVGAATVAAASTATATTAAVSSGAATTAAAGGSTAVAKSVGMAVVAKWLLASAVIVSGAAATVHVVSAPPDPVPSAGWAPPAPVRTAAARAATPVAQPTGLDTPARALDTPAPAPAPAPAPIQGAAAAPADPLAEGVPARSDGREPPEPLGVARSGRPVVAAPIATGHAAPPPRSVAAANGAALAAPAPSPASPPPPRAEESARRATVGDEIAHLDRARALLARGRGAEALEAINAYHRAFPVGILAEEALVLEVESLASAGQRDRARALGDRFVASHPQSPLVPRVVRAIGRGSPGDAP